MAYTSNRSHYARLQKIAQTILTESGFKIDFPPAVLKEVEKAKPATIDSAKNIRDMRHMLWCSIDNDDSEDLDQLSVAEDLKNGAVKIFVAIADVDAVVPQGSATDLHAAYNTTSLYTPAQIFPMLPDALSTDITSLDPGVDRLAMVIEMTISNDGLVIDADIYSAMVHNHAKLAYNSVAAWLEGTGDMPARIGEVPDLEENLRVQHAVAQKLKKQRALRGSLDFDTIQSKAKFDGETLVELELEVRNTSKSIIEEFMVASNGVTARYLASQNFPSIRRVVKIPRKWDEIVKVAANYRHKLPPVPDSIALDRFLMKQKDTDPLHFPDLSLTIIKLLGAGEYTVMFPGGTTDGHFGLAVKDYAHSTAPNRRYPDIITQRLLKAALAGKKVPYSNEELMLLAQHCTDAEDAAKKAERQIRKSAEAMLMESRVGEIFNAVVTGVVEGKAWVRLVDIPVEGMLLFPDPGIVLGQELRVELDRTDAERGFIDFKKAGTNYSQFQRRQFFAALSEAKVAKVREKRRRKRANASETQLAKRRERQRRRGRIRNSKNKKSR